MTEDRRRGDLAGIKQSRQINREMTAKQLAKSRKTLQQNPDSPKAKEAYRLSLMAAAVGGSHPRQRIKRKRS